MSLSRNQKQADARAARARLCSRVKLPANVKVERVFYSQPSGVSQCFTLEEAAEAGLVFVFDRWGPDTSPLEIAFLRPSGVAVETR